MGWTTGYRSKDDAIRASLGGTAVGDAWDFNGTHYRITDRHDGPRCVWYIIEKNTRPMILVVRVKCFGGGDWGEGQAWGENCGPCEDGCPVSWLDRVPAPTEEEAGKQGAEWAAGFRARVRQKAAESAESRAKAAALRSTLKVGQRITLPDHFKPNALTVSDIQPRKVLGRSPSGGLYRITPKVLNAALSIC